MKTHADVRQERKKLYSKLVGGHITASSATARSKILADISDSLPAEGAFETFTPSETIIQAIPPGCFLVPCGPGGCLKVATEDEARAFYGLHGAHQIEPDDVVSFDDEIIEADNLVRLPHGSDSDD